MSKIFIISNTNFNISKKLSAKEWIKNMNNYFYDEFLPYLKSNKNDNDILIHLGNVICKTKNIDLNVLKNIQEIFEEISKILPIYIIEGENDKYTSNIFKNIKNINIIKKPTQIEILLSNKIILLPLESKTEDLYNPIEGNSYCFMNIDYLNHKNKNEFITYFKRFKKCYNGFYDKNGVNNNVKNLTSPYNIDSDDKRGFIVLNIFENKDRFIQNKKSPNFKKIKISNENDLKLEYDKKDYIYFNINNKLFIDNKLKIELLLSEYNTPDVTYYDEDINNTSTDLILDEKSISLNDMVFDYINNSSLNNKNKLLEEFKTLIEINKKKS